MKYIQIDVTDEDIREGDPQEAMSCPIALALQRKYGDKAGPWVGDTDGEVDIYDEKGNWEDHVEFLHSQDSARFVKNFDRGRPVRPRRFRLRVKEFRYS